MQALVNEELPRARARTLIFGLVAVLVILEQVRPNPESFDKQAEFFDRVEPLAPQMAGADAGHVVYDGSMPDYRHHIAAMWAGLWAKVPVMNGFSGAHPPGYPGMTDRPTVEELVRFSDPTGGRLVIIEWGPPVRRQVYQVEIGGHFSRVESQ